MPKEDGGLKGLPPTSGAVAGSSPMCPRGDSQELIWSVPYRTKTRPGKTGYDEVNVSGIVTRQVRWRRSRHLVLRFHPPEMRKRRQ